MKIFFYSLILCLAFQRAEANGPSCTRLFAAPAASKQSVVRVKDSAWTRLHNVFEKKSKGQKNPFIDAAMNADKTGLVHRDFRKVITNYDDLIKTIQLLKYLIYH